VTIVDVVVNVVEGAIKDVKIIATIDSNIFLLLTSASIDFYRGQRDRMMKKEID